LNDPESAVHRFTLHRVRETLRGKRFRSRDATSHPSYAKPLFRIVTTALDAVVHAQLQRANAGGSIRNRSFGMDCLA
jgi:hypothetical protein